MSSVNRKPTVFAPSRSNRIFFLAQLLQPWFGSYPEHYFVELQSFPGIINSNERIKYLYELAVDSLLIHNLSDAIFYSDKLVCVSGEHIASIYLLGECLFRNGDFKKVHHTFERHKVLNHNISFQLLAARALLQNKQYQLCMSVLQQQLKHTFFNKKLEAAKLLIKAQCYEAQQNKIMAVQCYEECLEKDLTNVQAFTRLVDGQLISVAQKQQLILKLNFSPADTWLKQIYLSRAQEGAGANVPSTASASPMGSTSIQFGGVPRVSSFLNSGAPQSYPYSGQQQSMEEEPRKDPLFETLVAKENISVLCMRARACYGNYQIQQAYEICQKIISRDSLCFQIIPIYSACLLDLNLKGQLYQCAHNLVENYVGHPVSWSTVGTYYLHSKKYEIARKYFQKAIMLDKSFLFAWMGMAYSFAIQDQSDQAMSIYRTIIRLFPGCAQAHLYLGMEYLRSNNLYTALLALAKAGELSPKDPLIYSQLGVIYYKQKKYQEANELHTKAISLCHPDAAFWVKETIITNLAHSYRKLKNFPPAISCLQLCVSFNCNNPQTYFSLAFVYHMSGQLTKAICFYHKALKFKHDNQFAQEMLQKALEESAQLPWDSVYNS